MTETGIKRTEQGVFCEIAENFFDDVNRRAPMKEQIEEMAKLACTCFDGNCKGCPFDFYPPCPPKASAKRLYNAGYRKQKEGEWVENEDDFWVMCSDCGTEFLDDQIGIVNTYNYCPYCGAKMKGDA